MRQQHRSATEERNPHQLRVPGSTDPDQHCDQTRNDHGYQHHDLRKRISASCRPSSEVYELAPLQQPDDHNCAESEDEHREWDPVSVSNEHESNRRGDSRDCIDACRAHPPPHPVALQLSLSGYKVPRPSGVPAPGRDADSVGR